MIGQNYRFFSQGSISNFAHQGQNFLMNNDMQDYLFDLRGYLILRKAVDKNHIADLNRCFDEFPDLEYGEWRGNIQRLDNNGASGAELQNIVEGGEPFERLIDHPAWIERLRRYCGEQETYVEGLFIDECFASIRKSGGFFPIHSGGQDAIVRNQYRYMNGRFRCGQVNILLALTDIGPGDGGTLVLPGSHKSQIPHPEFTKPWAERAKNMTPIEGSVEVHLKAGDALLFVDAVCHGASARTNAGERRVVIYRYGPSWGNTRYGYQYSDELLERLTPERRKILQPIAPRRPQPVLAY
jgi:ectoine hydroxylase-related dioxygenase (phytanoyl-CoA dioxygenase family)